MVNIKLFVEGGGHNNHALRTQCRRAFVKLLQKAGFQGRMPRIIACGNRRAAFDQFRTTLEGPDPVSAVLLVDSESYANQGSPWDHVATREDDKWAKPLGAEDEQLHFMVQCMEAWFMADPEALEKYFGHGFRPKALPQNPQIEAITKSDLLSKLESASKASSKGRYGKGRHSFDILAALEPEKIRQKSPWAKRFFSTLDQLL